MTPIAVIADDEEAPRAQLHKALARAWPTLHIVECSNGVDAWDAWLEHQPQVCFLDIRMPGMSGIDVARRIAGRTPVVFVTAFGDHALAAFEAGAVDYLMKPLDPARLAQAVQRAGTRIEQAGQPTAATAGLQALLEQLAGAQKRPPTLSVIQAGVGREVRQIPVADVVYFESDTRYTRVVYVSSGKAAADGEALIRTPLKELLPQLDEDRFLQVHRSVIFNRLHVASALRIDEGHMQLSLRGRPERLPVSRPFQGLFKPQ